MEVQITEPIYPKITELQGIADNNKITLSWTAPETGGISMLKLLQMTLKVIRPLPSTTSDNG